MSYPGSGNQWPPQDPNQPQGHPQQFGPDQGFQFPTEQYHGIGPEPAHPKNRSGLVIGLVVALVVLAGGGGTWIALASSSGNGGFATPHDAAMKAMTDLGNGDLLGVVSDLPPAESAVLGDTISTTVDQFKRLQVVKPEVDPSKAWSGTVTATGITLDDSAAETVNDHLTITKLVAGTFTVKSDIITNDFTDNFVHTAFPDHGVPQGQTGTINIAQEVRDSGQPVRIATEKVNGSWYPSLFYTIADNALHAAGQPWPTQSIPAQGSPSADAAVRGFAQQLVNSDVEGMIAMLDPNEMAVLHDLGRAINIQGSSGGDRPQITDMRFSDQPTTGGTEVQLVSLTMQAQGQQIQIRKDGACYEVSGPGGAQRECADQFAQQIAGNAGTDLPAPMRALITHLTNGLLNSGLGIVTTQVDGQWYISPGRTVGLFLNNILGSLQPSDITGMLKFADH